MRITVLRKQQPVNILFSVLRLFVCLVVCFQALETANGQPPPKKQESPAKSEVQPQPVSEISPSPSQTAIEQPQASVETKERESKPNAFWTVTLTDLIQVAINAVLLMVVFWQARINREQQKTMHDQSKIMEGELEITRESIKQSERALAANEVMAKAAEESARIAREAFYIGDRPYFGVTRMNLEGLRSGSTTVLSVTLMNGGETPAWRTSVTAYLNAGNSLENGQRWAGTELSQHIYKRFVPSGDSKEFVFTFNEWLVTLERTQQIWVDRSLRVFVSVSVHYKDMRGEQYSDTFNAIFNPEDGLLRDWNV